MTRAEILLWRYLKADHLGELSFRRQAPVGTYIDGETHDFESRQRSDIVRDARLGTRGYIVLRFSNDDVLSNLEGVLLTILDAARSRLTTPSSLSLPRKGGGNPKTNTPRTARHRAIRIRQEKRS